MASWLHNGNESSDSDDDVSFVNPFPHRVTLESLQPKWLNPKIMEKVRRIDELDEVIAKQSKNSSVNIQKVLRQDTSYHRKHKCAFTFNIGIARSRINNQELEITKLVKEFRDLIKEVRSCHINFEGYLYPPQEESKDVKQYVQLNGDPRYWLEMPN